MGGFPGTDPLMEACVDQYLRNLAELAPSGPIAVGEEIVVPMRGGGRNVDSLTPTIANTVFSRHVIRLSFGDRLRVLFGARLGLQHEANLDRLGRCVGESTATWVEHDCVDVTTSGVQR